MRRQYTRTLVSLWQRAEGSVATCSGALEHVLNGSSTSSLHRDRGNLMTVHASGSQWSCMYSTKEQLDFGCWRCGHRDPSVYTCHKCGTIQPPKDCLDAYALFGLKQDEYVFDIPLDELERKYKMLQKTMHPDKFSSASEEEQQYSAEQAALINRAYATLKDPLSRGSHLLVLLTEEEEDEGATLGGLPQHSDMLEAIMECREAIEEADDEETLTALKSKVDGDIRMCVDKLIFSFDSERNLDQAKEELRALRYLVRMQEAIIDKL